jgi:hypothetical protein
MVQALEAFLQHCLSVRPAELAAGPRDYLLAGSAQYSLQNAAAELEARQSSGFSGTEAETPQ